MGFRCEILSLERDQVHDPPTPNGWDEKKLVCGGKIGSLGVPGTPYCQDVVGVLE
jgi:hypothetical protein